MTDGSETLSIDARRLYHRWSAETWEAFCRGPAADLGLRLASRPDGGRLLEAYLALAREAVGLQYIDRASFDEDPTTMPTLLAALWTEALPRLLPAARPDEAGALLERAWNAGERLIHEPAWLNRYLVARLAGLDRPDRFEAWLRESLVPVLQAPPPARWTGPLSFGVLEGAGGDGFLPGRIHLAAPTIACVHHRREEGRQVAFLLRPKGESLGLGRTPCFGDFAPPAEALPAVRFDEDLIRVARLEVALPRFGAVFGFVVAPAGFVVASSRTSQRVWIVEAP
jgi:hypothetical protein